MTAGGWLRAVILACGVLLAAGCSAHDHAGAAADASAAPGASTATASAPSSAAAAAFTDGEQYVTLKRPAGEPAPTGPLEVIEVFSYGCPHCAEFAPYMDKLRTELPPGTAIGYKPAMFEQSWVPYAQAFYAARQLGVLDQTHDALFKAMLEHYPLNSLDDLAAFYARHGVDQQKFLAAATGAETTREMAADQQIETGWGIFATPTLVVGRRASAAKDAPFVALMRSNNIESYEQLQQVGLWMARHAAQG
ncbi:MAG TPA: thiol:disulfide interchange protein DsbA/DsbL [Rhodanobacteraceae bacterium]|nr:thiol:disulfide interchange protein DsbA/DsbL [Rhodanobacteraceae bacterium]